MPPKTPNKIQWDPDSLGRGATAIEHAAGLIEVLTKSGELSWRDPSVKQAGSGGTLPFAPVAGPAAYEELITENAAKASHEAIPVLTKALTSLVAQARYGSDGLYRMSQDQVYAEDSSIAAVLKAIDKSLEHPGGEQP